MLASGTETERKRRNRTMRNNLISSARGDSVFSDSKPATPFLPKEADNKII